MITTGVNVNTAYRIADQNGIPLVDENFDVLKKMVQPDEVLVALYLFGPFFDLEGAKKISSEEEQEVYRKREDFKHVGFFAVKKADLVGVKDLY